MSESAQTHLRPKTPAWQVWKRLQPQKDVGMSDAEAREAGILPPEGWALPHYTTGERVASARAWTLFALRVVRKARPRNTGEPDEDSLAHVRSFCREALDALGLELRISGEENRPSPQQGSIFMWNQTSHLDHLILGAVADRPFRSLYNAELARVPVYSKWLRGKGHYLVNRYDEAQWRESISIAARDVREEGISILVSPEGTRSWDGRLLPMKRGAFMLAIEAGAPIVPIVIRGAHDALPRGSGVLRRGSISVCFARPVDPAPFTQETRGELKKLVASAWKE